MKKLYVIPLLIILIFFYACSNSKKESLKIGLIAGLSGKYSDLGNSVLRGASLAFEEVGFKINDQPIELIVKDDKQDEKVALTQIQSLLNSDIHLIIGNATSSMTKISIDAIKDKKDVLLISPSASSDEFSNIDDNFLRTHVAHSPERFDEISDYLLTQKISKIAFIYDEKNLSYVNAYMDNFEKSFQRHGGEKNVLKASINEPFPELLKKLNAANEDLIVMVANSIDSAKFIQYLRINHNTKKVLSSLWAKTTDFVVNGGKHVEGVMFVTELDDTSSTYRYLNFVKMYQKRYAQMPSVFAAQAYETAHIIIEALRNNSNIASLKHTLLSQKSYDGLQGKIIFNEFGDVFREHFIVIIKNGQFVKKD
ncbi:MAG: ABC transporter substrate-binding protein [Candidatus Marinarcus sp.]|uniref:ABC transporter substrate-binding protein n=1 Tax=Candidatus Marinarcus sp. TaxID=3100987 RepID=UPI003AFFD386